MAETNFADINDAVGGGNTTGFQIKPDTYYSSEQDPQSTGQIAPYKVLGGATRGDQQIKGRYMVVDNKGRVRLIMGFQKDGF